MSKEVEVNSGCTLPVGREKSVQTDPVAKSITALAIQTNMAIAALAPKVNMDVGQIWKNLQGQLNRIIGLRDDPLTFCGDVRDDL